MAEEQPSAQLIIDLRTLLRDTSEFNRILETDDNKELSDTVLNLALRLAKSEFNAIAPLSGFAFNSIPIYLILMSAVIQASQILGYGHTRNEFSYTSGGVSVQVFNRTTHYMNWINSLYQRYQKQAIEWKVFKNVEGSLAASVPSEYSTVAFVML